MYSIHNNGGKGKTMTYNQKESNNKESSANVNADQISQPTISLPKGGGAIKGIDEKFSVNPATGTASLNVPIFTTPGRQDFYPRLSLSYDSGSGNGPFALGWNLSVPCITRKTDKGLPLYIDAEDSDTFILSGAEDLVPSLVQNGDNRIKDVQEKTSQDISYNVYRFRPRIEGLFARIERWVNQETGISHWVSISKDNIKSVYGKNSNSRISDPEDESRIFKWLLEETSDDKGNIIIYEYKQENTENIDPSLPQERNRLTDNKSYANKYLKRIKYGNQTPFEADQWLFEVVFDYGEHDTLRPEVEEIRAWLSREDAFSGFRPGFEIRTQRLCQRVLMFHHFPELGDTPRLVRSTDFTYDENPVATYLAAVTQTGYTRDNGTGPYSRKSLPPLEFTYTQPEIDQEIRYIDARSLENLPAGLDTSQYRWVDLDGEGVSGILTEQGDSWFYKRNLGNGEFGPAQLVAAVPSLAHLQGPGGQQFLDLAADGQKDLVLLGGSSQHQPVTGFYERREEGEEETQWNDFIPFSSCPNIDWTDPNLRFIDLNGDGHTDILVTEDNVFKWYPSLGEEGFAGPEFTSRPVDEEGGPALVFADASQSIYLADMTGDGLTDIVRVRSSEVCYWPNMGYGNFGPKVTMDNPPHFDHPDCFNQNRVRLADIDGSGTTDIIYPGREGVKFWSNQAGNSWSDAQEVKRFPMIDNLSAVTALDLLGNGTACLAWSSPLPTDAAQPMQYIDLTGGQKPHLLNSIKNNLGAETRLEYAPSTRFYLEDLAAGTPWISKLYFPVHVVERVEVRDQVSNTKLVTLYKYHHGYFDGEEREFRGFGLVEQWDTGLFSNEPETADEEYHLPPVYTKTWFHTGASFQTGGTISRQYREEYYRGDPDAFLLADSIFETGSGQWDTESMPEAYRALKGQVLRREIYAQDDQPGLSEHPYTVTESNARIRVLQPKQGQDHAVFFVHPHESITYYYERNPDDPRISHRVTVEVDEFGNVLQSAAIAYPRRTPAYTEQEQTLITYTVNRVTNKPVEGDWYRIGIPIERRTYQLTGTAPPDGGFYTFEGILEAVESAVEIPYEGAPDTTRVQKRLIECVRNLYRTNDLTGPLPIEEVESLALPYETYTLAFTSGLITGVYGGRVDDSLLRDEGKYLKGEDLKNQGLFENDDEDETWWIPSGLSIYAEEAEASSRFYLPIGFQDPFGQVTGVTYDDYNLLLIRIEDPLGSAVSAQNNYRTMQPERVTDPNNNRSAVQFDELGMVVATALMGKEGETDPAKMGDTLAEPTTRLEYELSNWMDNGKPNFVHTFARERHRETTTRWQESYTYSDGLGREVMKKIQAEPGPAPGRDQGGELLKDGEGNLILIDTSPNTRWVGTGRTVFDNKGNAVKKYEPFFSSTHEYEDEEDLVEWGVTPILRYDPLSRLIRTDFPNGTFSKVEFNAWRQIISDENDTVTDSAWYQDRQALDTGNPEYRAAQLAAAHAGTPQIAHLDVLGRTFLTIEDNGGEGKYETRTEMDIKGNPLMITDARGIKITEYAYDMQPPKKDIRREGDNSPRIYFFSIDAGEHWILDNAARNPVCVWDSRQQKILTIYDELKRPTLLYIRQGTGKEVLVRRVVYGEVHPDAGTLNLRGKIFQHYDGAGVFTTNEYDFKGNLLDSGRRLTGNYRETVDWSSLAELSDVAAIAAAADPLLKSETFIKMTAYDALNRPISLTTPDNSEIRPTYNEANLLEKVEVRLRGSNDWTTFVQDIDYSAKGQRESIEYGNGVTTEYTYDEYTFRLTNLKTTRASDNKTLQDLSYTYDPVGNITGIRDNAQQDIFFNNTVVSPDTAYEYDALYRLISAGGREHAGQNADTQPDHTDFPIMNLPHPNDTRAMRTYTEQYEYDEVGNILKMIHQADNGDWTRRYEYAGDSNRLLSSSLPGDSTEAPYSAQYEYDAHGNMTKMPHLAVLEWNFKDQLHAAQQQVINNGGTGEKTYYTYNAEGQRVCKVTERQNGTLKNECIYLGNCEIHREYQANGTDIKSERETLHITDDKQRIAVVETKTINQESIIDSPTPLFRFQLDNHLGSACLEVDETGAIISYEEYYPYGNTTYHSTRGSVEVSPRRYRYNGKERDEETGLYYYGARYYASWLGRWVSADPKEYLAPGLSPYHFCSSNPIVFFDELGERPGKDPEQNPIHEYNENQVESPVTNKSEDVTPGGNIYAFEETEVPTVYGPERAGKYVETISKSTPGNVIGIGKKVDGEWVFSEYYQFNDPRDAADPFIFVNADPQGVREGQIIYLETEKHFKEFLDKTTQGTGANFYERYPYAFKESLGGGNMDPIASIDYLEIGNLYVAGDTAYNYKDMGNFLWGMSMNRLGFSLSMTQTGAHINAFFNEKAQNPTAEYRGDEREPGRGNPSRSTRPEEQLWPVLNPYRWKWTGDEIYDQQAVINGWNYRPGGEVPQLKLEPQQLYGIGVRRKIHTSWF
jgi:RHS repeat-associated protein